MELKEVKDLQVKEQAFRLTALNGLTSAFIFLASLMLLLQVPLLPPQVSAISAIVLGIVAFKTPRLALGLMFLLAVPAYTYQFGLPFEVLFGMSSVLLVTTVATGGTGSALGIATGAIAAMLMFTPFFVLAVPLVVAVPLLTERGGKIGSMGAVVTFITLYVPLLVSSITVPSLNRDAFVPLLQQVSTVMKLPLTLVDLNTVVSVVNDSISRGAAADSLLDKTNIYITVFRTTDLPGRLLGVVLGGFLLASSVVAFGSVALLRWLEHREVGGKNLLWITPAAAMVAASLAFLVLLGILGESFKYQVVLDGGAVFAFLASAITLGEVGSLIEYWLRQRDIAIKLRGTVFHAEPIIMEKSVILRQRVKNATEVSPALSLYGEEALAQEAEQELSFTSTATVEEMDTEGLDQKVTLFQDLEARLDASLHETFRKTRLNYEDGVQRYNESLRIASEYGYSLGGPVEGLSHAVLDSMSFEDILKEQAVLNALYLKASESIVHSADELEQTLHSEVDREFKSVSLEIARNYLSQWKHIEAMDAVLGELSNIDRLLEKRAAGLEARLVSTIEDMTEVFQLSLVPAIEVSGDPAGAKQYVNLLTSPGGPFVYRSEKKRLPDLLSMVKKTRDIGDTAASVVSDLSHRIAAIEKEIESKVPEGYDWGKDSNTKVEKDIGHTLSSYRETGGWADVDTRMSNIGEAIAVIRDASALLKQRVTTREFLINYANVEYLAEDVLQRNGVVVEADLPVLPAFARQYLRLYAGKHPREFVFETDASRLRPRQS